MSNEATEATVTINEAGTQSEQNVPVDVKALRFIKGAEEQGSKVLQAISKLQKFSNRKYYAFTDEQLDELFGAIQAELDTTRDSFRIVEKRKPVFKF